MTTPDGPTHRPGTGELPHGRPPQTEFTTGLDYPRLGSVTFRRGTLTENQEALFNDCLLYTSDAADE